MGPRLITHRDTPGSFTTAGPNASFFLTQLPAWTVQENTRCTVVITQFMLFCYCIAFMLGRMIGKGIGKEMRNYWYLSEFWEVKISALWSLHSVGSPLLSISLSCQLSALKGKEEYYTDCKTIIYLRMRMNEIMLISSSHIHFSLDLHFIGNKLVLVWSVLFVSV